MFHHSDRQHRESRTGEQGDELPSAGRRRSQPAHNVAPLRGQPNHPSVLGSLPGQARRFPDGRRARLDLRGVRGHGRHGHKAVHLRDAAKGPAGQRRDDPASPGTGRIGPGSSHDPADFRVGARSTPGGYRSLDRVCQPPGVKPGPPIVVADDQAGPEGWDLVGAHNVWLWIDARDGPGRVGSKRPLLQSQHRPDKTWDAPARQAIGGHGTGRSIHESIVSKTAMRAN